VYVSQHQDAPGYGARHGWGGPSGGPPVRPQDQRFPGPGASQRSGFRRRRGGDQGLLRAAPAPAPSQARAPGG